MEPQQPTRERRGDLTRRAIFAAAEEVFGRLGYHGASIDAIAKAAGIGLGTFYLYFPSKLAAFTFVLRTRQQQWVEETVRAGDGAPDERTAAERGLRTYFGWIARRPTLARLLRESEFVDPKLFAEVYVAPARWFTDELAAAMNAGVIEDTDPNVLAWSVVAVAEIAALSTYVWQEPRGNQDRRLDAFIGIVMHTLGLDAAPA